MDSGTVIESQTPHGDAAPFRPTRPPVPRLMQERRSGIQGFCPDCRGQSLEISPGRIPTFKYAGFASYPHDR
jgi:hypothetical protein